MSNSMNNTLIQVDLATRTGMGIAAQKDQERIRSEAALRVQMKQGERYVAPLGDGALRDEVDLLAETVRTLTAEIVSRDLMIRDWMHSNEAFRRLQKTYGNKLGLSDEQRQDNYDQVVLSIAEEDQKFANTDLLRAANARLKKAAK